MIRVDVLLSPPTKITLVGLMLVGTFVDPAESGTVVLVTLIVRPTGPAKLLTLVTVICAAALAPLKTPMFPGKRLTEIPRVPTTTVMAALGVREPLVPV